MYVERDFTIMRILIIPSWYEKDNNKILGSFFKEQAIALSKVGHEVVVAYVYMAPMKEIHVSNLYSLKKKRDQGICEYIYSVPSYGSVHRGTWFERNRRFYWKLLKKVLREHTFDIIHVHSFAPAGYAISALKEKLNIPIVYTEHFSRVLQRTLSERHQSALIDTMKNADRVLSVSSSLKNAMKTYFNRDITVVPNVLSPLFVYRKGQKKQEGFRFISVGSLTPGKAHHLTIKTFHQVFKNAENVTLDIIGDGPERSALQQMIDEYGEQNRIRLIGRLSREETAEAMQKSNAFVLPSRSETFGVVYIEAMACGLPVIGTRNGGFEDIYSDGVGYILDVDDLDALCSAMNDVYTNNEKFDTESISKMTIDKYSEQALVESLESIYMETWNGRKEG